MTTLYTWAQNTQKLRRIMDKTPNATEDQLREEYINQGGLLQEETSISLSHVPEDIAVLSGENTQEIPRIKEAGDKLFKALSEITKESKVKKVKEAVKKMVKKVTKKK